MSRSDDVFRPALAGRKIPILTLDGKWHQLFNQTQPDKRIKRLEEKLNDLLKRQGKANTEIKDIIRWWSRGRERQRLCRIRNGKADTYCAGRGETRRTWIYPMP